MDLVLSAPRVVADHGLLAPGVVEIAGGRVERVLAGRPAPGSGHVALERGTLIPGLVDLQVNGFAGVDVAAAGEQELTELASALAAAGTTAFLPTLVSAPLEVLVARVRRLAATLPAAAAPAARALGIHLEGPFLSAARPGVHDPAALHDPTPAAVQALIDAAGPALRLATLAPERPGGLSAVARLAEAGATVAVGHSDATEAEARAAFDAGARMVTHLFNAQRGLHHREPGVVGAALDDPRVVASLIADGHHVAPAACRIAFAAAPGRIALVSDAVAAAGMPAGPYALGGAPVVRGGDGAVRRADGTLAGAGISLAEGVAHAVGVGVDLSVAVRAASRLPADALGLRDRGRLAPGARADVVWLDDALVPRATWIAGALVHGADVEQELAA